MNKSVEKWVEPSETIVNFCFKVWILINFTLLKIITLSTQNSRIFIGLDMILERMHEIVILQGHLFIVSGNCSQKFINAWPFITNLETKHKCQIVFNLLNMHR